MLNVFITVDTEVWPRSPQRSGAALQSDIARDIYGATASGAFGVEYQMDVLRRHGLKAVFFVESLCMQAIGHEALAALVQSIQSNGHEAQLHLHSEWLAWLQPSPLPGRIGQNLKDFTLDEQIELIELGLANLRACGAEHVCAFRAGNYGANLETLTALAQCGLRYDTSYNACYLDSDCGMGAAGILLQPKKLEGVFEIPISFFEDWPGHYRHAQLCACSAEEMQHALLAAWKAGWHSFVIVSHSFELIRDRKHPNRPARPDQRVIERFDRLCEFLGENMDKFQTRGFVDLDEDAIPTLLPQKPLRSAIHRTARRFGEQLMRRM